MKEEQEEEEEREGVVDAEIREAARIDWKSVVIASEGKCFYPLPLDSPLKVHT